MSLNLQALLKVLVAFGRWGRDGFPDLAYAPVGCPMLLSELVSQVSFFFPSLKRNKKKGIGGYRKRFFAEATIFGTRF